ncbi:MAG: hypothetical protein ABIF71_13010 [Planctomycetota bacterium]
MRPGPDRPAAVALLALALAASGCIPSRTGADRSADMALFVEYLVRGDLPSALKIAGGERSPHATRNFGLLLPGYRSLDDSRPRYPVFVENRQDRYPTIRELMRGGALGEGADGMLKYVVRPGAAAPPPGEEALFRDIILRENFDRSSTIDFIVQNGAGFTRAGLAAAFARVRARTALHGDWVERLGPAGTEIWEQVDRSGTPVP